MTGFWVAALFLLTGAVFLLPLLPALYELRVRRDVTPLKIVQGHEGNARHFAERFRAFIRDELDRIEAGGAPGFLLPEKNMDFAMSPEESRQGGIGRVVAARGALHLPDGMVFGREVYAGADLAGGQGNRYRAALAEGGLHLGSGSVVLRWAHGRRVEVASGATLLGRISAAEELVILGPAAFTRLSAPAIQFGADHPAPCTIPSRRGHAGRKVFHGDFALPSGQAHRGDVVAQGTAVIGSDAEFDGSLKGTAGVRVEAGAVVSGSLVSGRDLVILGPGFVAGPVVAEGEVVIGRDVVIGSPEAPTTVTAPVIRIENGARVHGSVWARERGVVES